MKTSLEQLHVVNQVISKLNSLLDQQSEEMPNSEIISILSIMSLVLQTLNMRVLGGSTSARFSLTIEVSEAIWEILRDNNHCAQLDKEGGVWVTYKTLISELTVRSRTTHTENWTILSFEPEIN